MNELSVQTVSPEKLVAAVLTQLNLGQAGDAAGAFAVDFRYKDNGIGLEFSDKDRLTEFFQKARELYPDHALQTDQVFAIRHHVITQWTLRFTSTEPFYGGLTRSIPVSISGISVVRTEDGEIIDWADYYDGLTAHRSALAAKFTEWIEY